MEADSDIKFMQRCLDLAGNAEGLTYPNPMVGAVLVHKGIIAGEGYHLKSGEAHAEVNAINMVRDENILKESVLYVNLEPCSHYGKTPPCADLIISKGIRKIIIGTTDTSSKVSGRGISRLRESGCDVVTGVLEKECRFINRRFFTFAEKRRPYIILKWAQSADGFIDIKREHTVVTGPNWITGKPERILVHKWRASEQAILAGAGTIRTDDPKLNTREWPGENPVRIILSRSGQVNRNSALFATSGTNIVFTENPEAVRADVVIVKLSGTESASFQVAEYLYRSGFQSLLVEGGAEVLNHFISTGVWDEARIFTGIKNFNDGIKAPEIKGNLFSNSIFSMSSLNIILNDAG